MANLNPAMFLGIDHDVGQVAPGRRASFVAVDDWLNVHGTWIDGVRG